MTASCQTCKSLLVGLLVVWSIVSLVIIAVWASRPMQAGSPPCDERLQEVQEKLEGAKVVWGHNKVALEEMVEELRENQTRQQGQIKTLVEHLVLSNRSLESCHQEQVVLNGNMTLLEQQMEEQKEREANLTALISLQREEMEVLEQNLTQASHHTTLYRNLNTAAEYQTQAAKSKAEACCSGKQFLEKQLSKCKEQGQRSSEQAEDSTSFSSSSDTCSSSSSLSAAVLMLTLPTCWSLLLLLNFLTCSSSPMM